MNQTIDMLFRGNRVQSVGKSLEKIANRQKLTLFHFPIQFMLAAFSIQSTVYCIHILFFLQTSLSDLEQ